MSAATPRWKLARALTWRVPAAVSSALILAVVLAMVGLGLTGSTRASLADTTPVRGLGLALLPMLCLVLATLTGLITGITVVACLVRDTLSGRPGRYAAGWARAWRTLPKVLVLGAVGLPAIVLSFLAWPLLSAVVLVRAAWRMRTAEARTSTTQNPRTGLWLAIPFAFTLVLLAALPTTWSALVAGVTLRESLTSSGRTGVRVRAASLLGLVALGATSWGLGVAGLHFTAAPGATTGEFAAGTMVLGLTTALLMVLTGTLLGFLTHTHNDPPAGANTAARASRSLMWGRFWRPNRLAGVASMVIVALLVPTTAGALGAAASAAASALARDDSDIVVNTLADSMAIDPDDCVDAEAQCGIRAALSKAAAGAAVGDPAVVRLETEGTIHLAGTLRVGSGVVVNGNDSVTLDAGHGFRALETFMATESEGGRVVLRNFTVTGGRSEAGGAGLFSDSTRVELDEMTFTDNVADSGDPGDGADVPASSRNGGAVSVPYTYLRVDRSTFNENYARSGVGGAIAAGGLTLSNSTFVNNNGISGRPEGGAVYATFGGSTILHVTVVGGGGVSGTEDTNIQVANSAIDAPAGGGAFPCARITDPHDEGGAPSVGNVDPTGTCLGKRAKLDPIGPLAGNGGPTKTVALLPGSPAIGAADADLCQPADQRGTSRDAASCDVGAFQAGVSDIPEVSVKLEVTPNPATSDSRIRLEATLSSDAAIPSGTVRFLDGADVLAENVTIDGNQRFVSTVDPLPGGPHQIHAEFVPDNGNPPQSSGATKLQVQAPVTMTVVGADPTKVHAPATITATITAKVDEPGAPSPTGEVTFTNGSREDRVDVVNGVAVWHVTSLERAMVNAVYSGDDYYGVDVASPNVTTQDLPTTTTISAPETSEYGDPVSVNVNVTDEAGPVSGSARLEVDGVLRQTTYSLTAGKTAFTLERTEKLSVGTHTLRVIADPEAGWSASSSQSLTVSVVKSTTSIVLDQPKELVWSGLYENLVAHFTGTGTATVRLLDGDTLLDERKDLDLSTGSTQFTFHIYETEPGTHRLTAQIVASSTAKSATSAPVSLVVTKAPSYIGLFKGPAPVVGQEATIDVYSRGGGAEGTLRLVTEAGDVLATAAMSQSGATLRWIPTTGGYSDFKVTLTPDEDSNYLPTSESLSLQTSPGYVSQPEIKWTPVPVAGSTRLTVTFPPSTPTVAGTVYLRDVVTGESFGSGTLIDGTGEIAVYVANRCLCNGTLQVVYSGSANHNGANFAAPNVDIPAHVTSTTIAPIPETLAAKSVLHLSARTSTATTGLPIVGTTIFTVNGTDLPAVTTPGGNAATATYQTTGPGPLKVTARYVPGDRIFAPSTSEEVTTTVSALDPPVVVLSTEASPVASKPFTMRVTATRFGFYIANGSAVTITDDDGVVVGTGSWTSNGFGTTAEVTVTPRKGGTNVFTAHYVYGDEVYDSSAPLTKRVAGLTTKLLLSTVTTNPVAGLPIFFTATFDRSETAAMDPGEMMLQLNANGVPVGEPVRLAKWATSVPITAVADRRGTVTYSVTTAGDGVSYGPGVGYLQVTPEGSTPLLTTESDSVVKGRIWRAKTTLSGQPGLQKPTGRVFVNLTNEQGQGFPGCSFEMPGTGCDVHTENLPRDVYTITTHYFGDSFYKEISTTGYGPVPSKVRVYSSSSDIRLRVTPDGTGYGWQVGEQVKLAWTAFDPHSETTPSGTVAVTFGGRTVCAAPASAGSCEFTAPVNPRAGEKYPWQASVLEATYTPDEALPSTAAVGIEAPRRCLPVAASIANANYLPAGIKVPAVTGTTCTIPGLPGLPGASGFLEGTEVTVALPQAPTNYKVTEWHLEANNAGRTWPTRDQSAVFTLEGATKVSASIEWAPTCVTVVAADNERSREHAHDATKNADYYDMGWVDLKTPSNCSSPYGMSVPEWKDLMLGIGHYAVGTDVQAMPYAWSRAKPTAWDPQYKAIGIKGAALPDATHEFPHMVVNENRYISGDFAIDPSMCTPVKLYAGLGGKLNVLSSRKYFRLFGADESGRCYTETGQAGYYAFSTIEVKATPDSPRTREGHFQNRWFDGDELATPASREANLKDQAVGEYPAYSDPFIANPASYAYRADLAKYNNYNPQFHGFQVPQRKYAADVAGLGVGFAEVRCMALNLSVAVPVKSVYDYNGPKIEVTAPNCGNRGGFGYAGGNAQPERGQPAYRQGPDAYKGQMTRNFDGTGLYLQGTEVTATISDTSVKAGAASTAKPGERTSGGEFSLLPGSATRKLVWSLADNASLRNATETKEAATLRVTMTDDRWVRGSYVPENCRTPYVKVKPAGVGGYAVAPESSGSCPDGKIDPKLQVVLHAKYQPNLESVWTMGQQREDDFSEVPDQYGYGRTPKNTYVKSEEFDYNDTTAKYNASVHMVELFYCGKLNVGLGVVDRNGHALGWRDLEAMGVSPNGLDPAKYLANAGSCPAPMMALPGSTVQVGLNGAGAQKFEFTGAYLNNAKLPAGQVPSARVNADGTSGDRLSIQVKPRCFTLKLGNKVAPATMPTCPGAVEGQWEYLPGTPVVVKFTGNEADTFNGWNGIDKEDGRVAAVIMNQDRDVSAKYRTASGIELATKIVTNIEQRVISALVSAATGAVAGFLFVAQLAALGVVGIAEGLEALGVHGEGIDRMKDGANAIQAGIDVVSSLADCTQTWATGGGAPPFSPGLDYADQGIGAGSDLLDTVLGESDTRAAGAGGSLITAYSMTTMFATGIEAYLQEPAESWANIVDIGSCVADKGRAAGAAAVQLGHS